jgi:ATP-dependent DNA helicase RecG
MERTIFTRDGKSDWSVGIVPDASLSDLDQVAILLARENFKQVNSNTISPVEIDGWSDEEFLNRAKITVKGKITRTAIILLGRPESTHFISPAVAKITWILKDANGMEKDYAHFEPPFLLAVDKVASKIRNLRYRYMQE